METKPERLQKILAAAGLASRRKAEELIAAGLVSVNGHVITEAGTKADPRLDEIRVDGKLLRGPERHVYIAMYKPKGHMTTVSDPEGRPTVMDLLKGVEERVFPVGRLDYMSEGLLLLTNDGDLMAQLTRAGSHVAKTYMVKVSGKPTDEAIDKLRNGIMLPPEPGLTGARGKKQPGTERRSFAVLTQPAVIELAVDQENPWFEVTLTEGRNRQLRRMFEQVGHHIEKIKRVRYGSLTLDLEPGQFRYLTPKEVNQLRKSLATPFKPKPLRAKRKGDRNDERKPRLDTARFVKGRRGKASPAGATLAASEGSAGPRPASRTAAASASSGSRGFQARDNRGPARRPGGPRGPEFAGPRFSGRTTGEERRSERPRPRKPAAESGARRAEGFEESRPKRPFIKQGSTRPGSSSSSRREATGAEKRGAKSAGGFGFDKFTKPKFEKPSKRRDFAGEQGEGRASGFGGGKPSGERPYGGGRPTAGDRDFAKGGSSAGGRRFSKGPGKPQSQAPGAPPRRTGAGGASPAAYPPRRSASEFKRSEPRGEGARGDFKQGEFKRGGFKPGGSARAGGGTSKFGKAFGPRPGGTAPARGEGGSFKRAGGGGFPRPGGEGFKRSEGFKRAGAGNRRPSSPGRAGGAGRPPRRRPGEE